MNPSKRKEIIKGNHQRETKRKEKKKRETYINYTKMN